MFDAVDLSTIAQVLDEEERVTMAERGTNTQEYRDFINVRKISNSLFVCTYSSQTDVMISKRFTLLFDSRNRLPITMTLDILAFKF